MAANASLSRAKAVQNDEFYTQYSDIEAEINAYIEFNPDVFRDKVILLPCDDPEWSNFTKYFAANFNRFGLKKLISTSYAKSAGNQQLTLFEMESPLFDQEKHETHGKLFTLTCDRDGSGSVDADDIEFSGYFVKNKDGMYEVLDGQQRITSFARYVNQSWQFAVEIDGKPRYFDSLDKDLQDRITNAPLTIYVCEGEPSEIQAWFETINIAGVPLVKQELRNASYHGSFVTKAREVFSNTGNANMNRWQTYVKGDPKRQYILEAALDWVSNHNIDEYMALHRYDSSITELKNHFDTVIDWIDSVFDYTGSEMCGLDWGDLYRRFHNNAYSKENVSERVATLLEDTQVTDKKGIFEYILGGEENPILLNIRVFDQKTKKAVYLKQTKVAQEKGESNCPLCALGHDANAKRIYKEAEMDADHVTAWSKGGATDIKNCQMLCRTHNHAKGNR